jgi:hypothetical protein
LNGYLYVFTAFNIYRIYGKGPSPTAVKITPEPFVEGIGATGPDAVWREGGLLYFLSLQGPMQFDGESRPVPIGEKIGRDWIDDLAADQLVVAAVGSDGDKVKFAVPESGETENSLVWVFDIATSSWWQEKYIHPRFYFRDRDSNGKNALFYAQGKFIVQDDTGTNDGVPSGTTSATVTTGTSTTSVTCSAATFYTTGSGLAERYAHFYAADGSHTGSRRISSNTATSLTWSASGAGGGNLTVAEGETVYVGPVLWHWQTKNFSIPNAMKKEAELHLRFDLQGEGTPSSLVKTDIVNNSTLSTTQSVTVNEVAKRMPISLRNVEYAAKLESRATDADIAIRSLAVETDQPEVEKGS